jgi:hypothetical protein
VVGIIDTHQLPQQERHGGLREGRPVPLLARLIPGAACPGDVGSHRDAACSH